MALTIQVAGKCLVKVKPETTGSLADLGYTINGVNISEQVMTHDVPGDENGGEQGPPIDIQVLGEMHVIRMEFSKYDPVVMETIRASTAGGTAGTTPTPGTLYFQGEKAWTLVLASTNFSRQYNRVIFKEPKEVNRGTIHSRFSVVAHAYKDDNGVIHEALS